MAVPADVLYASQQIREWLAELEDRASLATQNQMLCAVLHELRDHLTVSQIVTFADALPPLVRGIFMKTGARLMLLANGPWTQ